tara:strand:- start:1145 stop:1372 length:228 start_codon:yes stop_codon:yes gene_type:complete
MFINKYKTEIIVFIISFFIGIMYNHLNGPMIKIIKIFPTPDNHKNVLYKDKNKSCFAYHPREVPCDSSTNHIPIM